MTNAGSVANSDTGRTDFTSRKKDCAKLLKERRKRYRS